MAKEKEEKINKAAMIRTILAEHPDWKPKQVVEEMGKRGVEVSPQQVSQAKTAAKKKAPKEAPLSAPAAKSQPKDGALNVEALQALKDLARQVGTEEATRLVRALVD